MHDCWLPLSVYTGASKDDRIASNKHRQEGEKKSDPTESKTKVELLAKVVIAWW